MKTAAICECVRFEKNALKFFIVQGEIYLVGNSISKSIFVKIYESIRNDFVVNGLLKSQNRERQRPVKLSFEPVAAVRDSDL